jgi:hypothetical protein
MNAPNTLTSDRGLLGFEQSAKLTRFIAARSVLAALAAIFFSAGGTTTVYFSLTQPTGIKRGNWIQTDPKKGWFTILRLYSPLEPFFTKEWRPSEIKLVQ